MSRVVETAPEKNWKDRNMLDVQDIWKLLPHRYPFLLVDRVLEMPTNESIIALKNVTVNVPHELLYCTTSRGRDVKIPDFRINYFMTTRPLYVQKGGDIFFRIIL